MKILNVPTSLLYFGSLRSEVKSKFIFFRLCCHFSDQLCILLVSPVPLELKLWMYFSNRSISHYQLLKNSSDLPCCEPAIVHVSEQIRYFVESQPNVSDRERPNLLTSVRKFPLGIQTMFGRGEFSCDLPCRREKNSFRDAALRSEDGIEVK